MTRDELVTNLQEKKMIEILELVVDAESGQLEELELAPSLGLLRDEALNKAVLDHLSSEGVKIIYVDEEE